jgi:hypothetical protein
MFQTKVVEIIKTHNLCPFTFSFFKIRVVYEIMWINIAERGMSIACWTPKATCTHLEYVRIIAFLLHELLHERISMLMLYVHCLSRLI